MTKTYERRDVMLRRLSVNRTYLKIDLSRRVHSARQARKAGIEFAQAAKFRANGRGISFVEDSLNPAEFKAKP